MAMIDADTLKPYLLARDNARTTWRQAVAALSKTPREGLDLGYKAVKVAERGYYQCCEDVCNVLREQIELAEIGTGHPGLGVFGEAQEGHALQAPLDPAN